MSWWGGGVTYCCAGEPGLGSPYVQEHPPKNFVLEACDQFQPCTSAQTNPTPEVTLTLSRTRTRTPILWGARGRQGQSRGSVAFFPKKNGRPKRPASVNKTCILHKVFCRMLLHIGRVSGLRFLRRCGGL